MEIFGFKSFADRAVFEFAPGVTAFVGPNGSGKSNVVDALRWVFGEQNPRLLRGARWDEVIFAGSSGRRPLGLAEVSVTLDNAAGTLGVSYREVEIARRLLRSGDSEYMINRVPCRLKDIHDLIAGTGASGAAYAYVPQAAVDDILKSRPEDRREVLEEAAGLARYRGRRQEAERKLAEVDVARERLGDLVAEIERQIEPLAQEADAAESFLLLRTEHEDLSARLWADAMARLARRREAAANRHSSLRSNVSELELSRAEFEAELSAGRDGLIRLRRARSEADNRLRSLTGDENRWRASLAVLAERLGHVVRSCETLAARVDAARRRLDQVANELATVQAAQPTLSSESEDVADQDSAETKLASAVAGIASRLATHESGLSELRASAAAARKHLEQLRTQRAAVAERAAASSNHCGSLKARLCRLEARLAQAAMEFSAQRAKRKQASDELDRLRSAISCGREALTELDGQLQMAAAALAIARDQTSQERGRLTVARERFLAVSAARGRLPLAAAAKEASELLDAGGGQTARPLADLIAVQPGYEKAVSAALGLAQHALVTGDWADVKRVIKARDRLEARNQLVLLPAQARLPQHPALPAGVRRLLDVATSTDSTVLPGAALETLLAPFILVDRLDQAIELWQADGLSLAAVSPDGRAVLPSGVVIDGAPDSEVSPIELTRLAAELTTVIDDLEGTVLLAEQTEAAAFSHHGDLGRRRRDAISHLTQAERELTRLSREYEQLAGDARLAQAKLESGSTESEELRLDIANAAATASAAAAEADTLSEGITLHSRKLETTVSELEAMEQAAIAIRNELHHAELQLAQREQENRTRADNLTRLTAENETLRSELTEALAILETARTEQQRVQAEGDATQAQVTVGRREREAAEAQFRTISRKLQAHEQSVLGRQAELDKVSRAIVDLSEQLHRLELTQERLDGELRGLEIERRSLPLRYAELQPEHSSDAPILRTRREEVETELAALGPVNPGAAEQVKRLQARQAFLQEQEEDLANSAASLAASALELEKEIEVRFLDCFAQTRESFAGVFTALFGGGQADLELTDTSSPLTSGVEILAQPPGKRMTSLALLSGGERALTAIALLFALLGQGAAGFCVLDEVDAHLDEPNCLRFRRYLRSVVGDRQFLVVTHSKATMEAADILYGLTMEEDGVSRVISARLAQEPKTGTGE